MLLKKHRVSFTDPLSDLESLCSPTSSLEKSFCLCLPSTGIADVYRCVQILVGFFSFGDFSISLYFLVHSVPYKENMILRCVQISIGLDSLEDSVSLILIFWSLTLIHVVRIRVLLVLFHLVWFLFYFVLFDTDPFGEILIHLVEL